MTVEVGSLREAVGFELERAIEDLYTYEESDPDAGPLCRVVVGLSGFDDKLPELKTLQHHLIYRNEEIVNSYARFMVKHYLRGPSEAVDKYIIEMMTMKVTTVRPHWFWKWNRPTYREIKLTKSDTSRELGLLVTNVLQDIVPKEKVLGFHE